MKEDLDDTDQSMVSIILIIIIFLAISFFFAPFYLPQANPTTPGINTPPGIEQSLPALRG